MRFEIVETSKIVTGDYQRELQPNRVARIVARFMPEKLGVILLSDRGDDTYAVLDGQHRVAAIRELNIKEVHAIVLEGLTPEQEADYFRSQNENVVGLTALDLFRAGVCAGDPHFVTIKGILDKYGYKVAKSCGTYQIGAVGALSRIVQTHGFAVLEKTIEYISETWPTDTVIIRKEMLAGMSEFAARFGNRVTAQQFAARMSSKHPSDMRYEFQRRTEGRGSRQTAFNPTMRFTLCAIIVENYNKGLNSTSKKRLKLEWKGMDE